MLPRNTTTATAVITAPVPFSAIRSRQREDRSWFQCRTSPTWLSVKPMNTPIAYSGISRLVSALTATSSSAASTASEKIPNRYTGRSARR